MPNKDQLKILKQIIQTTQKNFESALRLIDEMTGDANKKDKSIQSSSGDFLDSQETSGQQEEVVEGVFDGQAMVGSDGKKYPVPENYASKSKMVQGDILKLTITSYGQYVYKQISPKERINLRGVLEQDTENRQFSVKVGERQYKVLTASVTYYDGKSGDQAVIIVPQDQESAWAAVEDIRSREQAAKLDSASPKVEELLGELEEI